MAWVFIAVFAAAGAGVARWYRKGGGSPTSSYSQDEQQRIRVMMARRPKDNNM